MIRQIFSPKCFLQLSHLKRTCISNMMGTVYGKYAAVDRVSKYFIHFNYRIASNSSNATNGFLRVHFKSKWLNLLVNTFNLPVLPFHGTLFYSSCPKYRVQNIMVEFWSLVKYIIHQDDARV